jgi:MFS transporter, DHA1 family, inner membrane transport protein
MSDEPRHGLHSEQMRDTSLVPMLIATTFVGIAGAFITIAMPGILLVLSQKLAFSADQTAWFASIEIGGMLISTLFFGQLLNTHHRKRVLGVAVVMIIAGNCLSALFYTSNSLLLFRLLTGLGEGVAVAALGAAAASFSNPDRLFAVFMSANMSLVTLYLLFLPGAVAANGVEFAFLTLAGLGFLGLLALPRFPPNSSPYAGGHAPIVMPRRTLPAPSVLGLLGCLGLNFGVGMIWPFMGALGKARGISPETVSTDLAMATVGGIIAGVCAAVLGLRSGRRLPLLLGTSALVVSALGLVQATMSFSVCTILFMFFWVFATSYFMGTVAAVPDGGRGAVLIPAAQQGGLALGPPLSAFIVSHFTLEWTVVAGSLICTMGAVAAFLANLLIKTSIDVENRYGLMSVPKEF